jgi:hypothetical protein
MKKKTAFSGKAKKEYLKDKKDERKAKGRGAGFSTVVCDWGSTAVSSGPTPDADADASQRQQGPKWSGAQLTGSGAELEGRAAWRAGGGRGGSGGFGSRGGRSGTGGIPAGAGAGLLVQHTRNKLSTFFDREDDYAVQQRKLDANRPLERSKHVADDVWAGLLPRPLPWPLPLVDGAFSPVIPIPKRPPWRR